MTQVQVLLTLKKVFNDVFKNFRLFELTLLSTMNWTIHKYINLNLLNYIVFYFNLFIKTFLHTNFQISCDFMLVKKNREKYESIPYKLSNFQYEEKQMPEKTPCFLQYIFVNV